LFMCSPVLMSRMCYIPVSLLLWYITSYSITELNRASHCILLLTVIILKAQQGQLLWCC